MEQLAERLKGLSDPTRLRAIRLLGHGELCVCDLMAALAIPQSKVSRHMSFLKNAGWVLSQRKGKWVYYSLASPNQKIQSLILEVLRDNLPELEEAQQDYARLEHHLETKKADSCK